MESPRVITTRGLYVELLLPRGMRGSAWVSHGKRYSSSFLQGLGGWDAIPFLRSCRGTRRTRTLRFSLLRGGERPGGHPDVASGGYSYLGCPWYATWCVHGGAVSSVVTSGCPKRSEGGFPVGTRTVTDSSSALPEEICGAPPLLSEGRNEGEHCLLALPQRPISSGIRGRVSPRAQPSQSRR